MSTLHRWWSALKRLLDRESSEEDLNAEVESYYDEMVSRSVARGLTPEEARRRSRIEWGGTEQVKESVRESRTGARLEWMLRDLRFGIRTLLKTPGFTIISLLTLAIGIGASTAIFTVLNTVVLKPLSYRDSQQLVTIWERAGGIVSEPGGPNPRHVDVWRRRAPGFSGMVMLQEGTGALDTGEEHPQLVGSVRAEPKLLSVLGVQPLMGRDFRDEEGTAGRDNVAILTHSLWKNTFGGDRNIIGRAITFNGVRREVVGVLRESFHFPNANELRSFARNQHGSETPPPAIFIPAVIDLGKYDWNGEYGNWVALARMKPGTSLQQAQAQMTAIEARLRTEIPPNDRPPELEATVEPFHDAVVEHARKGLWLLMAAVLGLMLIASLNLANAHLGRALLREREAAVRGALGASRWQIAWSFLSESFALAAVGGTLGVVAAATGIRILRHISYLDLPRTDELQLNGNVLLFSVALTAGSIILSGLIAAMRLSSGDPQRALQQGGSRTVGNRGGRRLRACFIGLQVFGCTVLLLETGLFVKSLLYLLQQDRGFETAHVAIAETRLYGKLYEPPQSRIRFDDEALRSLRRIPGVQAAGLISKMPLEGETWIDGLQRADKPHSDRLLMNLRWVSPGYFEAMQAKLVAGRFFQDQDWTRHCTVLSESLAKALWPRGNPIGEQVVLHDERFTVIGITGNMRVNSLKAEPARTAYLHYVDYVNSPISNVFFLVRGQQPAETLMRQIPEAIYRAAPRVTIARIKTFDAQVNDSLMAERVETTLLAALSAAALLLAMLGVYGVLSYLVAERRQEIGVRMALGATREKIYATTLGQAAVPVLSGLVSGLLVSFFVARTLEKLLYGVKGTDLSVTLSVASLFLLAAFIAAWLPARRAASIDPMQALRVE